jgi:hypothetical protein
MQVVVGAALFPSWVSEFHVCVDTERSGHVCEGDEEIGELIVDMVREPIKDVGALNKDRGGVRVRVPRSGTGTVGEIPTEEGDCPPEGTSTRVSCFEENVMEDVGDVKCFGGFSGPRKEAAVECVQIVLFDCVYAIPNRVR